MTLKTTKLFFFLFIFLNNLLFSNDKLVIISPHWEGIKTEFTDGFKKWYKSNYNKDVSLEWIDIGGTSEIIRHINTEFQKNPKGIGIDIFFGGGISPHIQLSEKNLLIPYKLPNEILNLIPQNIAGQPIYDKEHRWYGACITGFGIVYNKILIKNLKLKTPKSWEDLTLPQLYKWVSGADPRRSGSAHMMFEMLLQGYGWDKGWEIITKMGANIKSFRAGADEVLKDISVGESSVGMSIDFYAYSQIETYGKENIGFVMPENLTVFTADPISIIKGAKNLQLAKTFLNYVLSLDGQLLWSLQKGEKKGPKTFNLFRMAILPEIYNKYSNKLVTPINPFKIKSKLKYDFEKSAKRWAIVNDMVGCMIIDLHDELSTAWEAIIKSKKDNKNKLFAELVKIPISEEEAFKLSSQWENSIIRNKKIKEWTIFSQDKYKKVEAIAKR